MNLKKHSERKFDLITVGRACIDLNAVEYNRPMEETMTFSKYVGGSPANIAIGTAKLGLKVGFIGKISDDQHGRFIEKYMRDLAINTDGMVKDTEGRKVGLAFTEIKSPDECSILMYRENVADLYLTPEEISEDYIKEARVLLISGTALAKSPSREAVLKAVSLARKNDVVVAFELDYRPYTWKNSEETAVYYSLVAEQADVIIGTRDEFDMMENQVGGKNEATKAHIFQHQAEIVVIKHGVEAHSHIQKRAKHSKHKHIKQKYLKHLAQGIPMHRHSYTVCLAMKVSKQPLNTEVRRLRLLLASIALRMRCQLPTKLKRSSRKLSRRGLW